jgi:molybdopterin-containing oxidoreductase family iron-sulfur binding subunit
MDMSSENEQPLRASGGSQWRSLEEAHDPSTLEAFAAREFGAAWEAAESGHARRDFLRIMGASMSLAGLGACVRQPEEKIVPYVKQPEEVVPGKPRYFATSFERGGYATGVLAESHLGRPTHLEPNPDHPGSGGGLDPITQASVLALWDPERTKAVVRRGKVGSWGLFAREVLAKMSEIDGRGGAGFRILTPNLTSPSLVDEIENLLATLPRAKWHQYEPIHRDAAREGSVLAFGSPHEVRYAFERAEVVLLLDADVVTEAPGRVAYARDLMGPRARGAAGNRIYALESGPTSSGAVADHRFPLRASEMGAFLQDVAVALGVPGAARGGSRLEGKAEIVAEDLKAAGGKAAVVPGDHLPAEVHALALAVNDHLGALGRTVLASKPVHVESANNRASIAELTEAMKAGEVELLLVLDGNPVYDAPADLGFAEAYRDAVPVRVHASTYYDETARLSQWHLPLSHYLETWSDHRAHDGALSIVQPLIAPIYDSRSSHEIVAIFAGILDKNNADLVKGYYESQWGDAFEAKWRRALHDGVVEGTAFEPLSLEVGPEAARADVPAPKEGIEVVLRPCPSVWDGRYANNAWLQETPRPISRVVWGNAMYMAPETADELGLSKDEIIRVTAEGRTIEGPAWILPGAAPGSITVHLGYGRTAGGNVAEGVGFDGYPLVGASRVVTGVAVESTRRSEEVVSVQDHFSLEGRNHVRHATKAEYAQNPSFAKAPKLKVLDLNLYPDIDYPGRAWGMVIDLSACTGCNACMVACQSENNIPVVGKAQVAKGREMHWIRVDRYFEGSAEDPSYRFQPLTCMHCERAPCEPVCPVNATVHGPEGLNQMVYNRCVGTRYCSNNCPYKVRRFNFHLYADFETESLKGQRNPDVTVRSRGVMEKCSYCIQRIKQVTIEAEVDDKEKIPDGAVVTACQSACPTEAIVFGDINDPDSRVAKLKATPLDYTVLEELNTAPRTSYLAAIENPNPKVRG